MNHRRTIQLDLGIALFLSGMIACSVFSIFQSEAFQPQQPEYDAETGMLLGYEPKLTTDAERFQTFMLFLALLGVTFGGGFLAANSKKC